MKKLIALMMAALLLLSGCQATPEKGVVASKNDGVFEAALEDKTSPTMEPAPAPAQTAEPVVYEVSFDGEQGSGGVRFHVKVAEPAIPGAGRGHCS